MHNTFNLVELFSKEYRNRFNEHIQFLPKLLGNCWIKSKQQTVVNTVATATVTVARAEPNVNKLQQIRRSEF